MVIILRSTSAKTSFLRLSRNYNFAKIPNFRTVRHAIWGFPCIYIVNFGKRWTPNGMPIGRTIHGARQFIPGRGWHGATTRMPEVESPPATSANDNAHWQRQGEISISECRLRGLWVRGLIWLSSTSSRFILDFFLRQVNKPRQGSFPRLNEPLAAWLDRPWTTC
jgi:hypothetical protein